MKMIIVYINAQNIQTKYIIDVHQYLLQLLI